MNQTGPETHEAAHERRLRRATLWLFLAAVPFLLIDASPAEIPRVFPRTLYLVRHGAYATDSSATGDVDRGLTPLGIAQARLIAARLRSLPMHFSSMT